MTSQSGEACRRERALIESFRTRYAGGVIAPLLCRNGNLITLYPQSLQKRIILQIRVTFDTVCVRERHKDFICVVTQGHGHFRKKRNGSIKLYFSE